MIKKSLEANPKWENDNKLKFSPFQLASAAASSDEVSEQLCAELAKGVYLILPVVVGG